MDTIPQPEVAVITVGKTVIDGVEYPLEVKLTPFIYEPLTAPNEIRVAMLYSQAKALHTAERIVPCCRLQTVALGEYPYLAVSYAWGSLEHPQPIPLTGNKYISVTQSLYKLLCRLCPEDDVLPVWADQLCINQRDLLERGAQVQIMSEIYKQAAGMSVWLGDDDAGTGLAIDLMHRLHCPGLDMGAVNKFQAERSRDELKQVLEDNNVPFGADDPSWLALGRLGSAAWFSRLWTFQEVVVPKDLDFICGPHTFSLTNLYRALTIGSVLSKISVASFDNVYSAILHRLKYHSGRTDLIDILRDTSNGSWQCTDPRDRIYALVALQSREARYNTTVSYAHTIERVYEDAAIAITRNKCTLDILYRPRPNSLPGFPSWVPSWQSDYFSNAINDDHPQTTFNCSSGLKHRFEEAVRGCFVTKGKVYARIAEITAHQFSDYVFSREYPGLRDYIGVDTLIPDLRWKMDSYGLELPIANNSAFLNWLLSVTLSRGYYRGRDPGQFAVGGVSQPEDLAALLVANDKFGVFMMCKCSGRKIAVLDRSSFTIALVPGSARQGDTVHVLNGANVPIVMRPYGNQYKFVGDCYVHGIMYGEFITWSQEEGDRFELI